MYVKPKPKSVLPQKRFKSTTGSFGGVKQSYSALHTAKTNLAKKNSTPISLKLSDIVPRLKAYIDVITLHVRLLTTRGSTLRGITSTLTRSIITVVLLGFVYISFFDGYFRTQQYSINFTNNSYLPGSVLDRVISDIQQDRTLGLLPTNSYWFATSEQLSAVASRVNKDIKKVSITDRIWPSTLKLEITTEPVLATLFYGSKAYTIAGTGDVLGEDTISLATNPLRIKTVSRPSEFLSSDLLQKNDYSLLNKIYFGLWVGVILEDLNVSPSAITISSDLPGDPDILVTINKTILYFSTSGLTKPDLQTRITKILQGATIQQGIQSESVQYIDMRFSRSVFVCYTDQECARTL